MLLSMGFMLILAVVYGTYESLIWGISCMLSVGILGLITTLFVSEKEPSQRKYYANKLRNCQTIDDVWHVANEIEGVKP